jgi:hypothetical protein
LRNGNIANVNGVRLGSCQYKLQRVRSTNSPLSSNHQSRGRYLVDSKTQTQRGRGRAIAIENLHFFFVKFMPLAAETKM